ncbi:glycosyltransferase family 2 protein [Deinococcus sp. Arct2-2]|uniref:glycosyltransferase family 2 protein n=1 Tax=Deinococcus sp. Arct2-2 TaxID=2568653 RepID=UPI0010A433D6|nr:glycosyltransferase family 2 protein [Deinococcus sp. Arct2-2]THF69520.1 glycosyltransferase family 2 protein [Deinococcus sp. Arct2-2]
MLSIVIVNWNGNSLTQNTISKLILNERQKNHRYEIIVVDNASTDNSLELLKTFGESITLICSKINLGFAAGCNLGARQAKSELILFLNPDMEVTSHAISEAVDFMSLPQNLKVGILGIQLLDEHNKITKSSARFPQARMFLAHNLGIDKIFPILGHNMVEWDHNVTREVDQVIGAFFLTRSDLFKELNGFDEQFFVYFEEVDYAFRARKIGYKSVYAAHIQAMHQGEGTTSSIKGRRLYYLLRSRLIYGRKHFTPLANGVNFANTLLLEPIARFIFLISKGDRSQVKDLLQGFTLLYRDLPNILFRRVKQ